MPEFNTMPTMPTMPIPPQPWAPQPHVSMRPPMAVALESIEGNIVDLETAVAELLGRVSPVLTPPIPAAPCQSPGMPPKAQRSAVVDTLESLAVSVAQITDRVKNAIKRVEV